MTYLLKAILLLTLAFPIQSIAQSDAHSAFARMEVRKFQRRIQAGRMEAETDRAIGNLLKTTARELKSHSRYGNSQLADKILREWETTYKGFVYELKSYRAIGDHPGIGWLLEVHKQVHDALGSHVCKTTRIHDLWYLAYMIPVVFECVDKVSVAEYGLHFEPFLGIIGFWVVNGICLINTGGCGYMWLCHPMGRVAENMITAWVAPYFTESAYKRACVE